MPKALAKNILELLYQSETGYCNAHDFDVLEATHEALYKAFRHLEYEELIAIEYEGNLAHTVPHVSKAEITAKGTRYVDAAAWFPTEATVVKLHQETISDLKTIFETCIQHSDLPPKQKTALREALRKIPEQAMGELTKRMIDLIIRDSGKLIEIVSRIAS